MKKNNEEVKIISVRLNSQHINFVEKISEKLGMTTSEIVKQAIRDMHANEFKDYIVTRGESRTRTPEDRAKMQMDVAEAKRKAKEDANLEIAKALDGRIELGAGGGKVVKYFTYDKKNRYEQQLPLDMMSDDLIAAQYFPSKENVLERQAKGEVNYNPNSLN
jgi:predicted DNA-binding protein